MLWCEVTYRGNISPEMAWMDGAGEPIPSNDSGVDGRTVRHEVNVSVIAVEDTLSFDCLTHFGDKFDYEHKYSSGNIAVHCKYSCCFSTSPNIYVISVLRNSKATRPLLSRPPPPLSPRKLPSEYFDKWKDFTLSLHILSVDLAMLTFIFITPTPKEFAAVCRTVLTEDIQGVILLFIEYPRIAVLSGT